MDFFDKALINLIINQIDDDEKKIAEICPDLSELKVNYLARTIRRIKFYKRMMGG